MAKKVYYNLIDVLPLENEYTFYPVEAYQKYFMTNDSNDDDKPFTILSYDVEFIPILHIGDQIENDSYDLGNINFLLPENLTKILQINNQTTNISAKWSWITKPTETISGVGNFEFNINIDQTNQMNLNFNNMTMYDIFKFNFIIYHYAYLDTYVDSGIKVNDDILWSPNILNNIGLKHRYIYGFHCVKSKHSFVNNAADFSPSVSLIEEYVSDIFQSDVDCLLNNQVLYTIDKDMYYTISLCYSTNLNRYTFKSVISDIDIIINNFFRSMFQYHVSRANVKISYLLYLYYVSQKDANNRILNDLDVGLDSGIFTNLGSQITTITNILANTIVYTPVTYQIEVNNVRTIRIPGLISFGTQPEDDKEYFGNSQDFIDDQVIPDNFIPDFTNLGWSNFTNNSMVVILPNQSNPKWEFSVGLHTSKNTYTGDTYDIRFETEKVHMIFGFKIDKVKSNAAQTASPLPVSFMYDLYPNEMIFQPGSQNPTVKRVFKLREKHKVNIENINDEEVTYYGRFGSIVMNLPTLTLTLQQIFIITPNATNEPQLIDFKPVLLQVVFGLDVQQIQIVDVSPGEYIDTDGNKYFGFYCIVDLNVLINKYSDVEVRIYPRAEYPINFAGKNNNEFTYEFDFNNDITTNRVTQIPMVFNSRLGEEININLTDIAYYVSDSNSWFFQTKINTHAYCENHGANLMISDINIMDIDSTLMYNDQKVEANRYWSGYLYECVSIKFLEELILEASVPHPPKEQPQLRYFDEISDEIQSSLQMLFLNWYEDHQLLMDLKNRVERLELLVDEIMSGNQLQFWLDIITSVISFLPIESILSSIGSKLIKGLKGVLPRKGNGYSWKLADSFSTSKYQPLINIPSVRRTLVDDDRIADQVFKDLTIRKSGINRSTSYHLDDFYDGLHDADDLIDLSGKSSYFEQGELIKGNVLINTGLPKITDLAYLIDNGTISNAITNQTVHFIEDVPMNTVKFYTTPLGLNNEVLGNFFFKFTKENKNIFDQKAAEAFMLHDRKLLHAYLKAEIYAPKLDNSGIIYRVTYAGIGEGITTNGSYNTSSGSITFINDVLGKDVGTNAWIYKLRNFDEHGITEDELNVLMRRTFGDEYKELEVDTRLQMLYEKYTLRDLEKSRIYHQINAPDINRVHAITQFAQNAKWEYNLLFHNCQTFNRHMYQWLKNGSVPNNDEFELLLNGYLNSIELDYNDYVSGLDLVKIFYGK
ncbi:MAG: P1 [Corparats virus 1]|nr:MAG: P1 [Corparats virus 1]